MSSSFSRCKLPRINASNSCFEMDCMNKEIKCVRQFLQTRQEGRRKKQSVGLLKKSWELNSYHSNWLRVYNSAEGFQTQEFSLNPLSGTHLSSLWFCQILKLFWLCPVFLTHAKGYVYQVFFLQTLLSCVSATKYTRIWQFIRYN